MRGRVRIKYQIRVQIFLIIYYLPKLGGIVFKDLDLKSRDLKANHGDQEAHCRYAYQ